MPIYEYRCSSCGFEREILQKISDPVLSKCPACGAPTFKKKISAVAFRLSGNGWYETDFKTKGRRNISGDEDKKEAKVAEKGTSNGSASKEASKSSTPKDASE
ncbi:MAG: transcriptional regulator [Cellvibrionales bacterium TMED49]|nr:transcriptional regulator [Porticoccaceae bacterium]OUU35566.1 MAG: transcriptional regulator [Cellvibrionales bacterium TMED49]